MKYRWFGLVVAVLLFLAGRGWAADSLGLDALLGGEGREFAHGAGHCAATPDRTGDQEGIVLWPRVPDATPFWLSHVSGGVTECTWTR